MMNMYNHGFILLLRSHYVVKL